MNLYKTSLASAVLLLSPAVAGAAFLSVNLPGTTQYDGWSGMTRANYPAYATPSNGVGTLASYTSTWPAPFASNTGITGDAVFTKVSGSAAFAGAGPYQAGSTATFSVGDSSALNGLSTIVFQLEANYDETGGAAFLNGGVPTLYVNGGSTGIPASSTAYFLDGGVYLATNSIHAYQWDLTALGTPVTSFNIQWNGPASSGQITGMQLNQGTQYAQIVGAPVPEPGAALLALTAATGLLARRRRAC